MVIHPPNPSFVRQWLQQIAHNEVLVIGDIMLDCYVHGKVQRISPEAPIPILKIEHQENSLGGVGNVARNLAAIGAHVHLLGIVGEDAPAREINHLLEAYPNINGKFFTTKMRSTIEKTRFVANGQQMMRADKEDLQPLSLDEMLSFESQVLAAIKATKAKIIVFSDYGKGTLPADFLPKWIKAAKNKGMQVIIDPKGRDYNHYNHADIITPNRMELSLASGMDTIHLPEIEAAARLLMKDHNIGCVIATLSEFGMGIIEQNPNNPILHFPAQAQAVYDVAGAGDTVVALLAAGLAAGLSLEKSAILANLAASIVVAKSGTAEANIDEIAHAAAQDQFAEFDDKIVGLQRAQIICDGWRKAGQKIGFTNGCFDLVHPGHISLLHQAKSGCNRLVVGLNSDGSVRQLKGDTRPIQNQDSRAMVLAALSAVDLVLVFDEATPLKLINQLKPDVLIKGADYSEGEVVGAKEVKNWDGTLLLADLKQGHSTTHMVAKMNIEQK